MKTKIVMDSSGDIKRFPGTDFSCVPLSIIAGNREFVDDENLDVREMVSYLKEYKGKSSTACPSTGDYLAAFEGYDNIYVVTITGSLSGSYNSALVAAKEYMEKYPDRKVHVFDSLSTGPEMVMLAEKIREFVDKGMQFEDVVASVTEYHDNVRLVYSLESLQNLVNNGRVPSALAAIVNVLNIRFIGIASDQGTLQLVGKARGEKKVVPELMKYMEKDGYDGGKVIIAHCFNEEKAVEMKNAVLEKYPGLDITINPTGALCSFYAEKGSVLVAFEQNTKAR
ncbi:MAG: DegV family protein [Anaerofustis stercorihominis]|nr:DegV family protein [Anaerofustis stercorihominis]